MAGKASSVSPQIDQDIVVVTAANSVFDSCLTFANAVPGWIEAAKQAALDNGATASQLQPLTDLVSTMQSKAQAVADAIVANTPVTPSLARAKK